MTAPSYTSWHVGMKVVLVGDNLGRKPDMNRGEATPKKGTVYTIREITTFRQDVAIRLVEIVNPVRPYIWEDGSVREGELMYFARGFRPVQTRQTDISVFTSMLSPKPAKAKKVRA